MPSSESIPDRGGPVLSSPTGPDHEEPDDVEDLGDSEQNGDLEHSS